MELGPNPGVSIRESTSFDLLCFSNIVSIIDSFLHANGPTEISNFQGGEESSGDLSKDIADWMLKVAILLYISSFFKLILICT